MMHPFVLVPEGALDAAWLSRLASVGEAYQAHPPFTSVYGVAPTENGAVQYTATEARKRRPNVLALVDGDTAGRRYEAEIRSQNADIPCIGLADDWTIEDVVGWAVEADPTILNSIATVVGSFPIHTVRDLVATLKTKNDVKAGTHGLKDDQVAHDVILDQLTEPCLKRVGVVLDALVCCALGTAHPAARSMPGDVSSFRLEP